MFFYISKQSPSPLHHTFLLGRARFTAQPLSALAQVVETSVTVNNNSPIQDYVHPDDQTQPTFEMTPGFKPFTRYQMLEVLSFCDRESA